MDNTLEDNNAPKQNNEVVENKKPEQSKHKEVASMGHAVDEDESSGGHFMAYFLVFIVLSIAGYIVFHNKQKFKGRSRHNYKDNIFAIIIEGKSGKGGRRPNTKDYKQLKTDDVMPSLEKSAYSKDYVF
ncbi:trans-Golgi network integral membrane protein TGN38-like [Ruditapes philippinarum]|uniref:trans-Golgi network integral membrane protein TGN38-like n=1 Tax=Ruditapes philippinarum TaxID=129788 RepID=UPI00295B7F88|nr:trans-Golgi network integral membrane protein TGN38-like [Ruditapes philippinarum]